MNREFLTKNHKIFQIILLILVIVLQTGVICHYASERTNFFVDEFFSFGYAQSYTFEKKYVYYIDNSPEWKYEEWLSNEVLKPQLEVSEEESLLKKDPGTVLKLLLTRRNFHGILNILMDVFSSGKPAKWPPIIFNIICFVFSQILLFRIVFEMTHNYAASLLAVFMNGFTAMTINTHIYVRFYALVLLLVLACIRIHQKMWQERRLLFFLPESIFGMLLLYFALKNSELIMIMGGAIVMVFTIALLFRRRFRDALLYVILVVPASLLYLLKKTSLIDIVLHPETYQNKGGATGWITDNFLTTTAETIHGLIYKYVEWAALRVFGSWYVLRGFLVLFIVLLAIRLLVRKKAPNRSGLTHEEQMERTAACYVWIILGASAIFFAFALLTGLRYPRYFSFFFPLAIIILWTLISFMTKGQKYGWCVYAICFVLVAFGAISTHRNQKEVIDYTYTDDQALIDAVHNTDINDAVVIFTEREDANHSAYDCINLLPYSAKLYPVDIERHHIDTADLPDQIFVWSHTKADSIDEYTGDLVQAGYSFELLGTTHTSVVYVARKS